MNESINCFASQTLIKSTQIFTLKSILHHFCQFAVHVKYVYLFSLFMFAKTSNSLRKYIICAYSTDDVTHIQKFKYSPLIHFTCNETLILFYYRNIVDHCLGNNAIILDIKANAFTQAFHVRAAANTYKRYVIVIQLMHANHFLC